MRARAHKVLDALRVRPLHARCHCQLVNSIHKPVDRLAKVPAFPLVMRVLHNCAAPPPPRAPQSSTATPPFIIPTRRRAPRMPPPRQPTALPCREFAGAVLK
jgi:hypothetical protein